MFTILGLERFINFDIELDIGEKMFGGLRKFGGYQVLEALKNGTVKISQLRSTHKKIYILRNKVTHMKFGSEWFSVVIGTFALTMVSWMNSILFKSQVLFDVGKVIYFLDLVIFAIIFFGWISRIMTNWREDMENLNRISFTAFLGVILFVAGFFFMTYVEINYEIAYALLVLYFLGYSIVFLVNVFLGYKLFTKGVRQNEISYALLVPGLALSANVFLSAPLLPPSLPFISTYFAKIVYFIMLFSVGITFFQVVFIGSIAFLSHIINKESSAIIMLPVGAASVLAINVLVFPCYNYLHLFYFPPKSALTLAIMLWGFEIWNSLVALIIAVKHIKDKDKPSLTSWAYVFPLGISSFLDFMLYQETSLPVFEAIAVAFSLAIVLLYAYSLRNTILVLRNKV
jgi:tellurite resistance protein TehA-like permease